MFLASACTCAVYGKRRLLQSAHVQVLAKNMAAKKTPYGFVAGVTSLYVSTLCPDVETSQGYNGRSFVGWVKVLR